MRHAWWLLPVLIIAGLWTWLAPRTLRSDTVSATESPPDYELGFAATDAELIENDGDGQPMYRLRAQRIAQVRPDTEVVMTAPELRYDDRPQSTWTLQSEHGTLSADRRFVAFSGSVQARRQQPRSPPLDLRSDTLKVDLRQRQADTATPVEIQWGRARLNADGLHADMVTEIVVLDGHGRGRLRY